MIGASVGVLTFVAGRARALDKQGSAHGGKVDDDSSGFAVSGNVSAGAAIINPSYAARPDNSGLALFRAAGHLDVDLIGSRLSVPIDVNLFTDRKARPGARVLVPSEIDLIGGLTSTWPVGPGKLEGGARVELDQSLDRGGYPDTDQTGNSQIYGDVRMRYLLSLAAIHPAAGEALADGDLSGWLTLGWFAVNTAYFARPDNTGIAFLRYAGHVELSVWKKQVAVAADATFFTDRRTNAFVPSELDLTTAAIVRPFGLELQLAYERDMPVDRGGMVQHFVYTMVVLPFDVVKPREPSAN